MKAETLSDPAVEEFAGLVRRLNNIVGSLDTLAEIEFLEALDELLPLIYSAAYRLPDIWDLADKWHDEDEWPTSRHSTARKRIDHKERLHAELGRKLGWHRVIRGVYDPFPAYGSSAEEAAKEDLARVLGDVCADLLEGLAVYDQGDERSMDEAIWEWKFGLVAAAWGDWLVHAMVPLHFLVHRYYDEDEERFRV